MSLNNLIYFSFIAVMLLSCRQKERYIQSPFYDMNKKQIGDSIFLNDSITKIVFIDTTYEIDSIIFNRYPTSMRNLRSIQTFKRGRKIFENIEYYQNGNIQKYLFIDEENPNYYYERLYQVNGSLIKISGYLFFQGFIIDTASNSLAVKKGSTISYRIYYPNPPDCISRIYVKNDDGSIFDVFKKSPFLNFLQTVSQSNSSLGTFKVNITLEQHDKSLDTTVFYNKAVIYKVIL